MPDSPSPLASLSRSVLQTRSDFLRAIRDMPAALANIAEQHLRDRLERASGRPLLGEYAPWLIAELLGVCDNAAVRRLATAWLHIYMFTLMVDDLIDHRRSKYNPGSFIVGSLVLQRGLSQLFAYTPSPSVLRHAVDIAYADTAMAALRELQEHRSRLHAFTPSDVDGLGQKLALLRICIDAMATLPHRAHHIDNVRRAVAQFATGIQLLDDLTDICEDYAEGNYTLPLTVALQSGHIKPEFGRLANCPTYSELVVHLVESDALHQTLRAADNAFANMLRALDTHSAGSESSVLRFVERHRRNIDLTLEAADALRLVLDSHPSSVRATSPSVGSTIRALEHRLQILAQSS